MRRYILSVSCPDRVGIVARVTTFLADQGAWVLEAAQHGDLSTGRFFLRIEVIADSVPFGPEELGSRFVGIAREFQMEWRLTDTDRKKKMVLLASKEEHCLADLLFRWRNGDLDCEIPCVISNHDLLRGSVEWHGIPFHHVTFEKEKKEEAFTRVAELVEAAGADLVVLARFMQILPGWFCERYPNRLINIHHSFLPSFAGARPYHQAFERGVKLIGATCHYATEELDDGPIIEQDTRRIDHGDSAEELMRIGRDIESMVLARGVRWQLEDRVLVNGRRTVVFD